MASSFSHGEAFISSKPERTTTVTSSPPRRREERQQSMAVLPPPSTMTRRPIFVTWPNDTLESQSMPIWMFLPASWRPGMSRSRPRGAPEPTKIASQSSRQQRLEAVDTLARPEIDAEIEDVAAFLVDHRFRQPEPRDLGADHAARLGVGIEHDAMIAERREVARDRERGRAGADQRDAPAVLVRRRARQARPDIVLEVGGDALEAADRHRLFFHAATPARRLAGPVAGTPEHARKDVRAPIDHVGVGIASRGDQPDVFGNGGMSRTGPLAIDDLVESSPAPRYRWVPFTPRRRRVRRARRSWAFSGRFW